MIAFIRMPALFIKLIRILARVQAPRFGKDRRGHWLFFANRFPEVLNTVRIDNIDEQILFSYQDKKFAESGLAYVDSTFFSVFDFKLLEGNAAKPFQNINSIVLTSSEAKKYFGNESAIGKT